MWEKGTTGVHRCMKRFFLAGKVWSDASVLALHYAVMPLVSHLSSKLGTFSGACDLKGALL